MCTYIVYHYEDSNDNIKMLKRENNKMKMMMVYKKDEVDEKEH